MKILQFGKFYPPFIGGIELFMYDLTEELNKRGISCDVLSSNKMNKTVIDRIDNYSVIRAKSLGMFLSTSLSPSLIYWLRKIYKKYDIIHLHHPNPMANLALFLVNPYTKIVIHWQSDIIRQRVLLRLYHPLLIWMLKKADKIIASSKEYADYSYYLQKFKNKTQIIPLGINPNRIKEIDSNCIKQLQHKYKGYKIIFSLGRLVYYKGFEYLINSAQYLPDDHLILIGGYGELFTHLKKIIRNKKIEKRVYLLGKLSNTQLSAYYTLCDVFVLPSIERSEAFGLVQVEAMFFGKPIVSTCILGSGVSSVNINGHTGFVVEPKNSQRLAQAICKITGNDDLMRRFSLNSKKRFTDTYHISQITDQITEAYKSLITQ